MIVYQYEKEVVNLVFIMTRLYNTSEVALVYPAKSFFVVRNNWRNMGNRSGNLLNYGYMAMLLDNIDWSKIFTDMGTRKIRY